MNRLIGSSTQIAMRALNGNIVQKVFALPIALVAIVKNLIILIAVSLFLCPMALYVLKWILAICLYQTGLEEYVPLFLSESPKQCSGHWFWKSCKNKKRMWLQSFLFMLLLFCCFVKTNKKLLLTKISHIKVIPFVLLVNLCTIKSIHHFNYMYICIFKRQLNTFFLPF